MGLFLFGKHPGYGDFLAADAGPSVGRALQVWIDDGLGVLREQLGDGWNGFWDRAPRLRFWAGPAVLGETVAGLYCPSRDRVGRRYPLVLALRGRAVAPPVLDPDQSLFDGLSVGLDAATAVPGDAGAMLAGISGLVPNRPEETVEDAVLSAHHPGGNLGALLSAARDIDHARAALDRSYWWTPGGDGLAATWLACPGLPDADALAWALSPIAAEPRSPDAAATEESHVDQ